MLCKWCVWGSPWEKWPIPPPPPSFSFYQFAIQKGRENFVFLKKGIKRIEEGYRGGILGHQFDKSLEAFVSFYSQSFYVLKTCETRKFESIRDISLCRRKNWGRNPDKNWR
jgi:hypothetical protein